MRRFPYSSGAILVTRDVLTRKSPEADRLI
jgi:hypothetical protein